MKRRTKDLLIGGVSSLVTFFLLLSVLAELASSVFGNAALLGITVKGWIVIGAIAIGACLLLRPKRPQIPRRRAILMDETSDERRERQWAEYNNYFRQRNIREFILDYILDSSDNLKGVLRGEGKYMGRLIRFFIYAAIFFFIVALMKTWQLLG
jgi:hypothetical protein